MKVKEVFVIFETVSIVGSIPVVLYIDRFINGIAANGYGNVIVVTFAKATAVDVYPD